MMNKEELKRLWDSIPPMPKITIYEFVEHRRYLFLEFALQALENKEIHKDDETLIPLTCKTIYHCLANYLNDGWEPDWNNKDQDKWYYAYEYPKPHILHTFNNKQSEGQVVFRSRLLLERAGLILSQWTQQLNLSEKEDYILTKALGI